MKNRFFIILSVIILFSIAIGAYLGANRMIDSIYAYRSPISIESPKPGQSIGKPQSEKVVFILIDALRLDTSTNLNAMPYLNKLRSSGAYAIMHSQTPSYSAPGYTTIFTGAWPYMNDGPAFNLDYEEIPVWTQDNLFSAIHRNGITTGISAYNWFEKLVPQQDVDLKFYTPGEDNLADESVVTAAMGWLEHPGNQFILVHIDQVDYAGHYEGGPQSQEWLDAANRADTLVARIGSKLDLKKDTIIVLSDHGQIDPGGHGGHEPIVLVEPFIMSGKGIIPGEYPDIQMVDVAPTISALLGANIPSSSTGNVITGMLDLPPEYVEKYLNSEELIHAHIAELYGKAINQPMQAGQSIETIRQNRIMKERSIRLPITLVISIIPPLILLLRKNHRLKFWLPGALIAFLGFHLRYGIIDRKSYSFSAILTPVDLIIYCAITASLAVIIGFIFILVFLRRKMNNRLDAAKFALGYVFTSLYLWFLPLGWNFILNGFTPTWTLPQLDAYFIGLLSMVILIIVSISGLLITFIFSLTSRLFVKV
jgi:hypothetical protein